MRVAPGEAERPGPGVAPQVEDPSVGAVFEIEDLRHAHHRGVEPVGRRAPSRARSSLGRCGGLAGPDRLAQVFPEVIERIPHATNEIHVGPGRALDQELVRDIVVPVAVTLPVEESGRSSRPGGPPARSDPPTSEATSAAVFGPPWSTVKTRSSTAVGPGSPKNRSLPEEWARDSSAPTPGAVPRPSPFDSSQAPHSQFTSTPAEGSSCCPIWMPQQGIDSQGTSGDFIANPTPVSPRRGPPGRPRRSPAPPSWSSPPSRGRGGRPI